MENTELANKFMSTAFWSPLGTVHEKFKMFEIVSNIFEIVMTS